MMARIGYLTALVSGRPDGQLLQPPRRLFPAVSLAEAELALQQVPGPARPGPPAAPAVGAPARPRYDWPAAAAARQLRPVSAARLRPGSAARLPWPG